MKHLLAYLQLLRLPNVFTAMADIAMGFLVAHGSLDPWREFALLVVASSAIYLAGMVLNDWFDREVDRVERPERPLPSGRVPATHALVLGVVLLGAGVAAAWMVGATSLGVALLLVTAVLLYDGVLKATLLGPAVMGSCRALNVLLGMSSVPGAIWLLDLGQAPAWRFGTMAAAGMGLYIMGVTRFARREATASSRVELTSSTLGINLGLLLFALLASTTHGSVHVPALPADPYWLWVHMDPGAVSESVRLYSAAVIWALVVLVVNGMVWRAVVDGSPQRVQAAVKTGIVALVGLDAAAVALVNGPVWAAAVLALLVPTLTLGRWVYST